MKLMTVLVVSLLFVGAFALGADGEKMDILSPFYDLLGAPFEGLASFVSGGSTDAKAAFYARFVIFLVVFSLFYAALNLVFTKVMQNQKKGPVVAIALGLGLISSVAMPANLLRLLFQYYGLFVFLLFFAAIFGVIGFAYFMLKKDDGTTHPWVAFGLNLLFFLFFSAMKSSLLQYGDSSLWDSMGSISQINSILNIVYTVLFLGLFLTGGRAISTTFSNKNSQTPLDNLAKSGASAGANFVKNKIAAGKAKKEELAKQEESQKKLKETESNFDLAVSRFFKQYEITKGSHASFADVCDKLDKTPAKMKIPAANMMKALVFFKQNLQNAFASASPEQKKKIKGLAELASLFEAEVAKVEESIDAGTPKVDRRAMAVAERNLIRQVQYFGSELDKEEAKK